MSKKECPKGRPFQTEEKIPGNYKCSRCGSVSSKKKSMCKPEEIKDKKKKKKKKKKE